jgi:outer membrane biosynthesis protein TonB
MEPEPEPQPQRESDSVTEPEPEPETEAEPGTEPETEAEPGTEPEAEPEPESEPEPEPQQGQGSQPEPEPSVDAEPRSEPTPGAGPEAAEPVSALAAAMAATDRARESGDRRLLRSELEELVELLRERATGDPSRHGRDLVAALRELAALRLRSGDWWGSRGPAKEAKSLAREWGLD